MDDYYICQFSNFIMKNLFKVENYWFENYKIFYWLYDTGSKDFKFIHTAFWAKTLFFSEPQRSFDLFILFKAG